jgi:hypothetical protein
MTMHLVPITICACRNFDWDGDARWQAHQHSLEVPDPAMMQRAKARWYKREIVSFTSAIYHRDGGSFT